MTYSLRFHTIEDKEIIVYGLFHCARNPDTIGGKLRDRDEPGNP